MFTECSYLTVTIDPIYSKEDNTLKILITSDWYTYAINGVVTSILNLKQGLEALGHEVRILTLSPNHHSYEKDGVTYTGSVSCSFIYPGARLRTSLNRRLLRELREWKPDIVHSNCEFSTFFTACHIARELDIPLVHTYHTVYEDYATYLIPSKTAGRYAARWVSRWSTGRTECVIVPSEKIRTLLVGYNITVPIEVIPTGLNLSHFSEPDEHETAALREKLGIPADCRVAIFLGRMAKEKNCEELLRAMRDYRGEKLMLLMVGDGPYREELENLTDSLGIRDRVLFTGAVSPNRVGDYYHLADFFVGASTSETQGLTYFEAAASGLPLLCRRDHCLDGLLLQDENGRQYDTPEALVSSMEEFAASPERLREMHQRSLEIGQTFSAEAFGEKVETVYLDCIRRHRSRREAE